MDYAKMLKHLDSPSRPFIDAARRAVGSGSTAEVAWHRLVEEGLVPSELAEASWRRFVAVPCYSNPMEKPYSNTSRCPPTIRAALTVAASADGFLAVEAKAHDFVRRLTPWAAQTNNQIVWVLYTGEMPIITYMGPAFDAVLNDIEDIMDDEGIDHESLRPEARGLDLPYLVNRVLGAMEGWRIGVERGLELRLSGAPNLQGQKRIAEIENPFEPLVEIWSMGYFMHGRLTVEYPGIRLFARQIDD